MTDANRLGVDSSPGLRVEDQALLTGRGQFLDDIRPPGTLSAFVARSTIAHARFKMRNLSEARRGAGVRLILVADDVVRLGPMPVRNVSIQPDGSKPIAPPHPVLARECVRYVGEPFAFVVADTLSQAMDAAEALEVEYDPLPVVVGARDALRPGAPLVWPDRASNLAFEYHLGDQARTDSAFAGADRVVRVQLTNQRVAAAFMETRGAIGEYDSQTNRFTLTAGTQGVHVVRRMLADEILKIDPSRLRVVTPDTGGAFGVKMSTYPEYALAILAAERLGRPVKWIADRTEHFLADNHGRDHDSFAEMAMDSSGRFLALRIDTVANVGAYCSEMGAWVPFAGAKMATGCYDIQALFVRLRGVHTNTMQVDAYRGAGRPEAAYLIERLVDACARASGLAVDAIRRVNFIRRNQMPYRTPTGWLYDTCDFAGHMSRALEVADWAGFPSRAEQARERDRIRGIGLAAHIDACTPPGGEPATLALDADGGVTLLIGTQTAGQGHASAYAQYVARALGIGRESIRVVQGDSDRVAKGGGTAGSRSIPLGAASVDLAARALAEEIKHRASVVLEAAPADLELRAGRVGIVGTDRSVTLADLAAASPIEVIRVFEAIDRTYPNGTHVAEVEIDPSTGATRIVRYTVVDDFGHTVHPMLLKGQVHGGVAQGIGQALMEHVHYDATGQLLSASFLDYAVPRADDLTMIEFETRNVLGATNPLGVRGAGEAGTMGSCPAVMNAIADALHRVGVGEWLDMPATPERVWRHLDLSKNPSRGVG